MSSGDESEVGVSNTPPEVINVANAARLDLLPKKSVELYDKLYILFMQWCNDKKINKYSENVLLAYFAINIKRQHYGQFSMITTTLISKNKVNKMVLALTSFGCSNATSQRTESIPANHNPRYRPDLGVQAGNAIASRRVFVSPSNSVAASSLILESHHEVTPTQATRFAVAPAVSVVPTASATSLEKLATAVHANPVLAALLISSLLSVKSGPKPVAYNTPEHLPPDPYVALMLSHYGRYVPRLGISGHGLYGYIASNNIHNTKPFGNYKIYEDSS